MTKRDRWQFPVTGATAHKQVLSCYTLFSTSFLWSRNHAWACQPVTRDPTYIFHDSAFLMILMSLFTEFLWVRAAVIAHSFRKVSRYISANMYWETHFAVTEFMFLLKIGRFWKHEEMFYIGPFKIFFLNKRRFSESLYFILFSKLWCTGTC